MSQILKNIGVVEESIITAGDGRKAISLFIDKNPDLITMDITMPDIGGIEALEIITKIDRNAKIIMVSAMGQDWFINKALVIGAKGFIIKPFKKENIKNIIKKIY